MTQRCFGLQRVYRRPGLRRWRWLRWRFRSRRRLNLAKPRSSRASLVDGLPKPGHRPELAEWSLLVLLLKGKRLIYHDRANEAGSRGSGWSRRRSLEMHRASSSWICEAGPTDGCS